MNSPFQLGPPSRLDPNLAVTVPRTGILMRPRILAKEELSPS